ncbi:hypothetical protein C7E12_22565, partial [Stenotrophomonas maltophilia]
MFFGTRVEQPASASAAAMERNRDALFMGMTSIGTAGWQEATAVFFGTRVEQPASASAAAMERNRDALFMGMT